MSLEICGSCGEAAVIEDSIDGGRTQRICVECGSIADNDTVKKDSNRIFQSESGERDTLCPESPVCQSCGDDLDVGTQTRICAECAPYEEDVAMEEDGKPAAAFVPPEASSCQTKAVKPGCKSCGSSNMVYSSIGVEEKLVCQDCGSVVDSIELTHDSFEVATRTYRNGTPTLPWFSERPKKRAGLVAGRDKIQDLIRKFALPAEMKEEATELFEKAYFKAEFFMATVFMKEHMAAACLFVVARRHDFPVSLTHFIKYVANFRTLLTAKKRLVKCLELSIPHASFTKQIGHCLAGKGFESSIVTKVRDILFLCRKAWLTQGRNREGLISIGTYYAYICSPQCVKFLHFKTFRDRFSMPHASITLTKECNAFFLTLANRLPWVNSESVKLNTIHHYIDDILKYQNSLLHLAFLSEADSSILMSDTPKKRKLESDKKALMPLCMKKPKLVLPYKYEVPKIPPDIDLDSPELKSTEFEEEIDSYILSAEEQAAVGNLKAQFWAHKKTL